VRAGVIISKKYIGFSLNTAVGNFFQGKKLERKDGGKPSALKCACFGGEDRCANPKKEWYSRGSRVIGPGTALFSRFAAGKGT